MEATMLTLPSFYGTADAHTRRVTLNLVRASTVCPDDLVFIVDGLSDTGWDWNRLSPGDAEAIFGLLTDDLVQAAKAEFAADTRTVIDVERHRSAAPDFIDDEGDTFCPLCGHKHIRWGFTLRNTVKHETGSELGSDLLTGSTCVVQYGLRVDAETTAEAALAALNRAIGRLQRHAEREDWQRDHPTHASDMALLTRAEGLIGKTWWDVVPRGIRNVLPYPWGMHRNAHHKTFGTWARATLKYYHNHGYLTFDRTEQLRGALETARSIVAQVDDAIETSPPTRFWRDWVKAHPVITSEEAVLVKQLAGSGLYRNQLRSWQTATIEAIEARHRDLPPPPPFAGSDGSKPKPAVMLDDVSDLPGMI